MTTSTLLSLPDELLVEIFLHLPLSALLAVQLTSHHLNATVAHSVLLQYHTLLKAAQYADNPSSPLSILDRLAALKKREEAWVSLRPTFTKEIEVQHQPSPIYDLVGGVFLLGDKASRSLFWMQLPVQEEGQQQWRVINMGTKLFVVDMSLCVDEHDLIGVVTKSRRPSTLAIYTIELHLLQFSASSSSPCPTPHPLAALNPLHILDSPHGRPSIGLEIVGDHLVLILLFPLTRDEPDRLFVYNWRSGHVVARFIAPHGSYYSLVFLTERWFLLPNTKEGTLEVYEIPSGRGGHPDGAAGIGLTPIHVLGLPALAEGCNFRTISCRGDPNPLGEGCTKLHTTMPCYPSPEDAIIIFTLSIRSMHLPEGFGRRFSMYVHRKALLEVCTRDSLAGSVLPDTKPSDSTSTSTPPPIPYRDWGRPITRWFNTDGIPDGWITTTAGQRAVIISSTAHEHAAPYIVLDFNQGNVQRAKKALGHRDEADNPRDTLDAHGSVSDDEVDGGDDDDENPHTGDEDWEYQLGPDLLRNMYPESPHIHPYVYHPGPQTGFALPPNRWLTTAFHPVEPNYLFDRSEGRVGGSLPYVACSSAKGYKWSGVMIDGESVVGVLTEGPNPEVRSVQVDVFG